jgi:hypothetical protein
VRHAWIKLRHVSIVENRWTDADIAFEMGLENWDLGLGNVPDALRPKRFFRAWIEDWEFDCIHNRDEVAETRLLYKYGGMMFIDPDTEELCVVDEEGMEWQGGKTGAGWCVIGRQVSDGDEEPWVIDIVMDEIAKYEQQEEMNVELIVDDEKRAGNAIRIKEYARTRPGNKKQPQEEVSCKKGNKKAGATKKRR